MSIYKILLNNKNINNCFCTHVHFFKSTFNSKFLSFDLSHETLHHITSCDDIIPRSCNIFNDFTLSAHKLGGPQGYSGPDNFGVAQYAGPFWVFGGVITATIIAWRLKFSGWGRALRALREDEIAAAAVGVDPTRYKVTSFVISAMGAGVAGALLASMRDGNPSIQPEQFGFALSFDAITMVILGGSGSVSGAVLGGLFVTITVKMIEQLQRLDAVEAFKKDHPDFDLNALRMVVYAIVLILLMVLRPAGVFGENEISRFRRRKEDPNPPASRGPKSIPTAPAQS